MLNYECKNHRGRSHNIKTSVLCIVEVKNGAPHVTAKVIPNKKNSIIIQNVIENCIIHAYEHRPYCKLPGLGYVPGSVYSTNMSLLVVLAVLILRLLKVLTTALSWL